MLRLDPDERRALCEHLRPYLAAERRPDGEHVRADEPEERRDDVCRPALDVDRNVALVRPESHVRWLAAQLHRDVGARVAGADEEDVALAQLGRLAVLARVHLHDARVELGGEVGDVRRAVEPGRDDDVIGLEAPFARTDDVAVAVLDERGRRAMPLRTGSSKRSAYASR